MVTREDKLGLEEGAYLEIWLGGGGSWGGGGGIGRWVGRRLLAGTFAPGSGEEGLVERGFKRVAGTGWGVGVGGGGVVADRRHEHLPLDQRKGDWWNRGKRAAEGGCECVGGGEGDWWQKHLPLDPGVGVGGEGWWNGALSG